MEMIVKGLRDILPYNSRVLKEVSPLDLKIAVEGNKFVDVVSFAIL
jgi:hypothetical protein